METATKYEYQATSVNDDSDDLRRVDLHLKLWADRGWELVSGCANAWRGNKEHTKFVMYWQKSIGSTPEPTSI